MRVFTFFVTLGALLIAGLWWLSSGVALSYMKEPAPSAIDTQRFEPEPPPPESAAANTAPLQRIAVEDGCLVRNLEAENARLRARIEELEQIARPIDQDQLAVVVGVPKQDVLHLLDRSALIPDAKVLAEVSRACGASATWRALKEESNLYQRLAQFKADNPIEGDRIQWHHYTYAPFLNAEIVRLTDRLYQLGLPSTVVEPFRSHLMEGI